MPIVMRSLHRAPFVALALTLVATVGAVALKLSLPALVLFGSLTAGAAIAVLFALALATKPAPRALRFTTRGGGGGRPLYAHARAPRS